MPGEDYFDSKNQLGVPKAVVKKENVDLEHDDGNGSFVKSSSSNIFPKAQGHLDSFSVARSSEPNANFNSGYVKPGPNACTSSLITGTNIMSSGRVLTQTNEDEDTKPSVTLGSSVRVLTQEKGNADIQTSMALASSSNTLASGHVSRQNKDQGRKRDHEGRVVSSVSQIGLGSRVSKKLKAQASPSSPVDRLHAQRLEEFRNCDPQLRALVHHSRHQIQLGKYGPCFLPDLGVVQCKAIVKSLGQDFKRQVICPATRMTWVEDDVCSWRLTHFFNVMRNRPKDNNIIFWREFVSEFYAPSAKERWCFSPYTYIGRALSHRTTEGLRCESCGANSVRGFESSFEVLPWLWKTKFDTGVTDELLHLDSAQEIRFTSGMRLLKYENVVQESVFNGIHVKRHGKQRLTFGRDMKILSWEFCADDHEEYVPCCSVGAEKHQTGNAACTFHTFDNRATVEAAKRDMLASRNMFQSARHQLARTMAQPTVNDLRFSEDSVRSHQIGEVVDMMKDLMAFSTRRNTAPIESLQTYVHEINHNETESEITEEHQETSWKESYRGGLEGGNKFKAALVGIETDTASSANMAFPYSANGGVEMGTGYVQTGSSRRPNEPLLTNLNLNRTCYYQTGSDRRPDESLLMNLNLNQSSYYQTGRARRTDESLLTNLNLNRSAYYQTGSVSKADESLLMNLNLSRSNQEMACAVPPETGQDNQQNSVWNALGKQKEQAVVDTSGNIVPGAPIRFGSTSMIRNGPNYNYPTSVIDQYNLLVNVLGNAGSPFATSCSNSVNVRGSSSTEREESGNPESYLPAACKGM